MWVIDRAEDDHTGYECDLSRLDSALEKMTMYYSKLTTAK